MIDLDSLPEGRHTGVYERKTTLAPRIWITIMNFPCELPIDPPHYRTGATSFACAGRPSVRVAKNNEWEVFIPDWSNPEDPTFLLTYKQDVSIHHYNQVDPNYKDRYAYVDFLMVPDDRTELIITAIDIAVNLFYQAHQRWLYHKTKYVF